jgi:hypothetical protein
LLEELCIELQRGKLRSGGNKNSSIFRMVIHGR